MSSSTTVTHRLLIMGGAALWRLRASRQAHRGEVPKQETGAKQTKQRRHNKTNRGTRFRLLAGEAPTAEV